MAGSGRIGTPVPTFTHSVQFQGRDSSLCLLSLLQCLGENGG